MTTSNERLVWSVTPTAVEVALMNGSQHTRMTADLSDETPTPRSRNGRIPTANLSMVKHRATAKHPARTRTHSIETWTRKVGSDEITFAEPTHHERRHIESLRTA